MDLSNIHMTKMKLNLESTNFSSWERESKYTAAKRGTAPKALMQKLITNRTSQPLAATEG